MVPRRQARIGALTDWANDARNSLPHPVRDSRLPAFSRLGPRSSPRRSDHREDDL